MKKKLLFLSPLAFLLSLLLILPVTQAASNPAGLLAPDAPVAAIGGGEWERIWRSDGALFDFDCNAAGVCFAVGEAGLILQTDDAGRHWHQTLLPDAPDLRGVAVADSLILAAGGDGAIYHSATGGLTWTRITTPASVSLNAISLLDDGQAWAVGAGGLILHSADAGLTWQTQVSNSTRDLHDVQFVDASTGYAVGDKGTVLKTTDGGSTWAVVASTYPGWARINTLAFVDAQTGWIAGQAGYIRHTTDGGQSWQEIDSGTGVDIFDLSMGPDVGVFGGARGVIGVSSDGQSWTVTPPTAKNTRDVTAVYAQAADVLWAAGVVRTQDDSARAWFITQSEDGGSFSPVAGDYGPQPVLNEVAAPSKDVAYVVGERGAIGISQDGGESWAWQHFRSKYEGEPNIAAISCPTPDDCWIAGQVPQNPGFVYVTHDGGASWRFQSAPGSAHWPWMYDIAMVDAQHGHAAANPSMYYTSDGGETWQASAVVGNTANVEIAMASQYEGWTAQRNLGHRFTTNGGQSWQRYMPYTEQANIYFFGVSTLDVNQDGGLDKGWLVGCQGPLVDEQCPADSGVIFYAEANQDPGVSQALPANTPALYTITMLDAEHGWVGGAQGTLLYTDNGGIFWQSVTAPTTHLITGFDFNNARLGFGVTYGGEILRFRGPGRDLNSYTQSTPITVDGEIYDWHYGGALYLDAENASTVLGAEPYPAPEQLSAQVYSRWTANDLYIMAQISDDIVGPGDAVRLALDGLNDDAWRLGNPDDLLIFIAANGDFGAGSSELDAAIAHAVRRTDAGWQLELGIPADLLGRTALAENDAVGVNLAVDDNDGPGNDHSLLLSGRGLTDAPATWGSIRLVNNTLLLQNGYNDYKGVTDTFISRWNNENGRVIHGSDELLSTVYTQGEAYANTLIRFDLSALPEHAQIDTAQLALYARSDTVARQGFQVTAFRLLRAWEEQAANWFMADAVTPWGALGALQAGSDYDPTPLATTDVPIGFRNDWLTWDVSDAARAWQAQPESNHGLMLMGTNASLQLNTRSSDYMADASQRPKLVVGFTLQARPTPTPTPTPTPAQLYLPLLRK